MRLHLSLRGHARFLACCALFVLAHAAPSYAGPMTSPGAFAAAVAALGGTASTLDFDALAVGASPDGENGIHFNFTGDFDIVVTSTYDTTSGLNGLGVDDDGGSGVFQALDDWGMTFDSPLIALGLFFITNPDGLLAGDIELQTTAGVASNSATPFATLGDGGLVYFLGLISDGAPFSSATIGYGPAVDDVYFEYNVDDITTAAAPAAVPEPSTLALTFTALAALGARRRSQRTRDIKE